MTALKNARHEVFAQGIAKGLTQSEAYIRAGYGEKGARQNASRLIANDCIARRIGELQAGAARKHEINVDKLTEMLVADRELARAEGQASAAVSAVTTLAKLHGLLIDRKEIKQSMVDEIPYEEREAMIELLRGELARRALPAPR
jgi:hypothetical protein